MTVAYQRMFGILERWNNNQVASSLSKPHGLSYAWKSNGVNIHDLWSKQNGVNFHRCVMPRARFMFLSSCLRFDDKNTRNKDDRFSPIRGIWEIFIKNCTNCYQPSRDCTLDEILLGFRGRCKF